MSKVIKKSTASKTKVKEQEQEPEPDVVFQIKHKNMSTHYNNLKSIDIDNKKKEMNEKLQLPLEIINNLNNKPWIRIPYPMREIKLMSYMAMQIEETIASKGKGNLDKLIRGKEVWEIV